jgi:hypothetical protein
VPESYPGYSRQRTALKTLLKKRNRDSNLLPRNYSTENRKEQKVEKKEKKTKSAFGLNRIRLTKALCNQHRV